MCYIEPIRGRGRVKGHEKDYLAQVCQMRLRRGDGGGVKGINVAWVRVKDDRLVYITHVCDVWG